jgi:hypothetical protein
MPISFSMLLIIICLAGGVNGQNKPENMGQLFKTNKYLMGKNIFRGSIGYSGGLLRENYLADDSESLIKQALQFNVGARLANHVYFRSSIFAYLNKTDKLPPWMADYFYQFGRYNWNPNSFSYGYENYASNKFNHGIKSFHKNFLQGYYFGSYNRKLPKGVMKKIRLDYSTDFRVTPFVRYSTHYRDTLEEINGGLIDGKLVTGVGFRYIIIKHCYIEGAALLYPGMPETKYPWDPDFTYGFGYERWEAFKFNITYGNWVANRFPWNTKEMTQYGFADGDFKITFNYAW